MSSNASERVQALKELFVYGRLARPQYRREEVAAILDWAARVADEGGESMVPEAWVEEARLREDERHDPGLGF